MATKRKATSGEAGALRRRAERALSKTPKSIEKIQLTDMKKLVHELQVHQVELEMQNDELRRTQEEVEESRSRYADLYDFAPIGYFTLNKNGVVVEANLTGANLLGMERRSLIRTPFSRFVNPEYQDIFLEHRRATLRSPDRQACEIMLMKKDRTPFWGRMESVAVKDGNESLAGIRSAISEITERKLAEETLELRTSQLEKANQELKHQITLWEKAEEALQHALGEARQASDRLELLRDEMDIRVQERTRQLARANEALQAEVLERTQAQEALQQSELLLRRVLDNLPVGVRVADKDGRLLLGNPADREIWGGVKYTGIERYEAARGWWVNSGKPVEAKEWPMVRAIRKGETSSNEEIEIESFDGKRKVILSSAVPIRGLHGGVTGGIVINQDITERKTIEVECLRLSTAVEQISEAVLIMNLEGVVFYANQAFEGIYGLKPHEILGKKYFDILEQDGENAGLAERIRETILQGGRWSGRIRKIGKDGDWHELDVTISPVREPAKETINYAIVERDVTQEVKLQDHLRQKQKMEALGTLAGGIAHDFNNILASIGINTEMALEDSPPGSKMQRYLRLVLEGATRGRDLVKQVIAFSRQKEQERKAVRIGPVIEEVLKFLRASIPTSIEILESVDRESDVIMADPIQIHQVIMNLCNNAAYAMREKGGRLGVRLARVEVDADMAAENPDLKPGSYLRLSVSDTGPGMTREVMEKAFDPFFTTKAPGEGAGMGLAVVRGVVKSHSGAIKVYSEVGQGSTFNIFLPRVEKEAKEGRVSVGPIPKGTEHILIVEDEKAQATTEQNMLERLGYKVVVANDGVEALELFRGNPQGFDLVITDQTMPHMTGAELAGALLKIRQGIPIILCTGFSEVVDAEEARAIGVREFILKPFSVREMAEAIRRVFEKKT